jgi:hypothetical protein
VQKGVGHTEPPSIPELVEKHPKHQPGDVDPPSPKSLAITHRESVDSLRHTPAPIRVPAQLHTARAQPHPLKPGRHTFIASRSWAASLIVQAEPLTAHLTNSRHNHIVSLSQTIDTKLTFDTALDIVAPTTRGEARQFAGLVAAPTKKAVTTTYADHNENMVCRKSAAATPYVTADAWRRSRWPPFQVSASPTSSTDPR